MQSHQASAAPASPSDRETVPRTASSGRYLRWLAWSFLTGLMLGAGATFVLDLPSLVRRPPCVVGLLIGGVFLLMVMRRGRASSPAR